jgi:hypothetical protein
MDLAHVLHRGILSRGDPDGNREKYVILKPRWTATFDNIVTHQERDRGMKLRIRGDNIRFRLKVSEVQRIGAGHSLTEETHFPGSALSYTLDVADVAAIDTQFANDRITVRIPRELAGKWAATDEVSMYSELELGDGSTLSLLVEKDFQCLAPGDHRHDDDDEDSFPHPNS